MFPHGHPISSITASAVTALSITLATPTLATATQSTATQFTVSVTTDKPALTQRSAPIRTREYRAATSTSATRMKGIRKSLYLGKHYTPKTGETFRRCVINRESNGNYNAANATSSARGAYQFLDSQWRESLIHMLRPEAKRNNLLPQLRQLADKPIHKWSRYWQDAAFWTVYNNGAGAKHWASFGQTYSCSK